MQEQTMSARTLKTSSLLTVLVPALLLASGRSGLAWGFLIGALLSVFSLFSLMVVVPFLMRPSAPRHASALLLVTLFMKLPIFIIGLYLVTRLPGVAPIASIFGIALAPIVISLKTIGEMLVPEHKLQAAKAATADLVAPEMPELPEIESVAPRTTRPAHRTNTAQPVYEGG